MVTPLESALSYVQGADAPMDAALKALVEVNSFTDNPAGGRAVGALLLELFQLPGLRARRVPSSRYADHLVFESDGNGQPPVAMLGHLDTVFPPGTFEGYRVDGERRRGPGVLDMKGGLVMVAFALKAIERAVGLGAIPPLRLVVVADEEVGSPEGAKVIEQAISGAGAALVFESGRVNDAIVTQRKGTAGLIASASGKAAHAGNKHQEGANAIWAMAKFIDATQGLTDYGRGVTLNVGKVSGGQGKNTVPDQCEAHIDARFTTRADAEDVFRRLDALASQAGAQVPGTTVRVTKNATRLPMERIPGSAELLARYAACARASGLGAEESPRVGGGSDACTSSAMGIPSIDALGPRGDGFHTQDEYIEFPTMRLRAEALVRFFLGP